jgi:hypothetical protein
MKRCSTCKTDKDDSEFHKAARGVGGLAAQCKSCRSDHYKETYPDNKVRLRAGIEDRRRGLGERVAELKDRPCMDCGGSFPSYVMDFDHREGEEKIGGIANLVHSGNWVKLEAEIAKCDLVCANCHRIRTFTRMRGLEAVPKLVTGPSAKRLCTGSRPVGLSERVQIPSLRRWTGSSVDRAAAS